jgi:anti-anti-sigma regulatory factor
MHGEIPPDPEAGWGALHEMSGDHDAEGGAVRIAGAQDAIARVLDRTGMSKLFGMSDSRDDAVAALREG